MLDSETKRRIDTARDILVGKVPDPKSQVEQITIALIYKFMDDMDAESEEMGGERKFFTGEFGKYGWAKLMHSGLGGHEMLGLYGEAITRMPENPGIPPLFRDIFKNAYLPYRDPETLRAFLKIIDDFEYDHSERLGDAFEYLLSVLGSQGDAGQFRTPRHIIDFVISIVDPKKDETVLDPACGTAGFLISSYKHILAASRDADGNGTLTPDERTRLAGNFKGYDISPDMVRLSLVNMYLHGFTDPHIYEYDTLTSQDRWNEYADVILANPPFMSPKGGIKPHNRFSVQSKRSEVLFVDYMAEHLTPNGRAGIVVPEGIIFQSQTAYVRLRKMLVEESLLAVISLPAGVFNPYSGVKTSVLILDKGLARQSASVAFFKIENDGFNLGAQRRSVEGSEIDAVLAEIQEYLRRLQTSTSMDDYRPKFGRVVDKKTLAEDGQFGLNGESYRESITVDHHYDFVPLGEICDFINGRAFKSDDWRPSDSGGLPIIRIQNLNKPDSDFNYCVGEVSEKHLVGPGELLFSWSGSRGTSFGAHIWPGSSAVLNQHIFKVLFDESRVRKMYLYRALNYVVGEVESNLHGGVGLVHITKGNLERIAIPLPPLEIQDDLIAQTEPLQEVINAANKVAANYHPVVVFDPEWPVLPLGELLLGPPRNGYSGQPVDGVTDVKVLSLSATTSGELDATKFKYLGDDLLPSAECRCRKGDIYLQRGNTADLVGTAALFDIDDEDYVYPDLMIRVRPDESRALTEYVVAVLHSPPARAFFKRNAAGAAGSMPKINQKIVERVPIPLPPITVQAQIVGRIAAERQHVQGCRRLSVLLEETLQRAVAACWGRAESPDSEPARAVATSG